MERPISDDDRYVLYNMRKAPINNNTHTVFYKKSRLNTPILPAGSLDSRLYMGQSFYLGTNQKYLNWQAPTSVDDFTKTAAQFQVLLTSNPIPLQWTQLFQPTHVISKPIRYNEPLTLAIPNTTVVLSISPAQKLIFIPAERPLSEYNYMFSLEPIQTDATAANDPFFRANQPFHIKAYHSGSYVWVNTKTGDWSLHGTAGPRDMSFMTNRFSIEEPKTAKTTGRMISYDPWIVPSWIWILGIGLSALWFSLRSIIA